MTPDVYDPVRPRGFIHSRDRLKERYGIDLTPEEHLRLSRMVATNDLRAVRLAELNTGRLLVAVPIDGQWIPAVWSPTSETIVTFREPNRIDRYRAMLEKIDPETGARFAGRVERLPDGHVRVAEWYEGARNYAALQHHKLTDLGADAIALLSRWRNDATKRPEPADHDAALREFCENLKELRKIEEIRARSEYKPKRLYLSLARREWRKESGPRMTQLLNRNAFLRRWAGLPGKDDSGRVPENWWEDYAVICETLGIAPTVDPDAVVKQLSIAISNIVSRIGFDSITDKEDAAKNLADRWLDRNRKGSMPAYIAGGQTAPQACSSLRIGRTTIHALE